MAHEAWGLSPPAELARAFKRAGLTRRYAGIEPSATPNDRGHEGTNKDEKEPITRQRVKRARDHRAEATMNGLIYLVGLVVVIMFILSFLGLR